MSDVLTPNSPSYDPLNDLSFEGVHLIEASAGTGKTWTLSSVLVRILTEKYLPRDVIATTFTRAAAAELKTRIRLRLIDVQHAIPTWLAVQTDENELNAILATDPLFEVLYQRHQHDLTYLANRLRLVLESLDELFVGTLDSFTQKLLREFSFESGEIMPRQISEQEQHYPAVIAHDVLRAWMQQQPQALIDLLLLSQSLKTVDDYLKIVSTSLNFSAAYLQPVAAPTLEIERFNHLLQTLTALDLGSLSELAAYYAQDGEYLGCWDGRSWKKPTISALGTQVIVKFCQDLKHIGVFILFDSSYQKHCLAGRTSKSLNETILEFCTLFKADKLPEAARQDFLSHPVIARLGEFLQCWQSLKQQLKDLHLYLSYHLSTQVKQRLPQLLQQAGETTFNQQIRSLADALHGQKGAQLARVIQHRYPMILVDEFQDTNQDQDDMLRLIWRDAARHQHGCFIAVGDPKQAIYGFRGGDMLTYNNAKQQMMALGGRLYSLHDNHRSIASLVQVVNRLFLRQPNFLEQVIYTPVEAGRMKTAVLLEDDQVDVAPLRYIQLTQEHEEARVVAEKIRHLLWQAAEGKLKVFDQVSQQSQVLCASDIAVLAYKNSELDYLHKYLERMGIVVNRNAQKSVLSSAVAYDVQALLDAILHPEKEALLKRALVGPCIGLGLADMQQFEAHPEQLATHMSNFRDCRQLWMEQGFLVAWQWLLQRYQSWQCLVRHYADDRERAVVNLRHLTEILSHNSWQYQGIQHLIQWYAQQLQQPLQREWELERKLSSDAGVQLMTIHKSKGLEFKVVFLLQADRQPSNQGQKEGLGFYQIESDQGISQRAITISAQLLDEPARLAHEEKKQAEDHRLWYVALTRASYRMYLMLHNQKALKAPRQFGVSYWLDALATPFEDAALIEEAVDSPYHRLQQQQTEEQPITAQPMPSLAVYPKTRTSFSAIAQHNSNAYVVDQLADIEAEEQPAADEIALQAEVLAINAQMHPTQESSQILWIQQHFPRGTLAGNCLHGLFEYLDFQQPQQWHKEIVIGLSNYPHLWLQVAEQYRLDRQPTYDLAQAKQAVVDAIFDWIETVVHSPITGHRLASISCEEKLPEFDFFMALAETPFAVQRLQQLFANEGIHMPEFNRVSTARYLNGAIDLVYYDGTRFHIADYKSNYLGDLRESYHPQALHQNMMQSSYYLQAALYLVAVHRYLSTHYAGYNMAEHLGAAHYLYLRGMSAQHQSGVRSWKPSDQFILAVDAVLGQAQHPVVVHEYV